MDNQNKKTSEPAKRIVIRTIATCCCCSILSGFAADTSAQNAKLMNFADQARMLEVEEKGNLVETIDTSEALSTSTIEVTTASTTKATTTTTMTTTTTTKPVTTIQTTGTTTETVVTNVEVPEDAFTSMETVLAEPANNVDAENLLSQITVESTTEERIISAMDYFVSQGFTPEAAAGILGSIAVESGYNPSIVSSTGYYGLCQWNTSSAGGYWWNSIQDWIISNGFEWNSFEGQIRAIVECPSRGQLSDSRLEELKGLTNVDQAAELIAVYYEACVGGSTPTQYYRVGYCYQGLGLRSSEAWIAYNIYNDPSLSYTGKKPYIPN